MVLEGGRRPSPLIGLLLSNVEPPINSLPPRLCPWVGFVGVVGKVGDNWGGDDSASGFGAPAGLKEKAGRALTDFCL